VVGRRKSKPVAPGSHRPRLTVHQIVAYNFRRAREREGWTQVQTSEALEPYLGFRLNQAGVSAIEKTYDSDRRRNIDVAEVVAFARCFRLPIGWFFLPPSGQAMDLVEPVNEEDDRWWMQAGDLMALVLGTMTGWDALVARIVDHLESSDPDATWEALQHAFAGVQGAGWAKQIDLRRQAMLAATLARNATPGEQAITQMAELLVELVKLTPLGFNQLRHYNPDEALRLLAAGDELVQPFLPFPDGADADAGPRPTGGFNDLEAIDVERAFDVHEPEP
jgi:hypothetical protein